MTLAVLNAVPNMASLGAGSAPRGFNELHSAPLVTSDEHTRQPIGRLAERVPSLEDGGISLLPDGRMRVAWALRKGATWHDGTPFTAHDLTFAYRVRFDPNVPLGSQGLVDSVEAPDDYTLVVHYSTPYYQANIMGLRALWPLPRHILQTEYDKNDAATFINLPYWTDEYVHLGPFRLASFDPADTITLQAYDGYFLGRPKLDTIHLKVFTDANTLNANLLAGTVDMFHENTLAPNQAFDLMNRWHQSGEGIIYVKPGVPRFLAPQWRLTHQAEPMVVTDVRVRAALYHAIDREAVSEAMQAGQGHLAAFELLPKGEILHDATRDGLRKYVYDPQRAQAILAEVGWTPGPDRLVRHSSDGRTFRTHVTGTAGRDREAEVAIIADFWRRIGLASEEGIMTAAQVRDREARAQYPGWELSSTSEGDGIIGRLAGTAASAATRWVGNRDGYENPHADQLVSRYQSSLTFDAQFQAMRTIQELVTNELPLLLLYTTAYHFGVSNRVKAMEDHGGGAGGSNNYGSFSRNGHLWELR